MHHYLMALPYHNRALRQCTRVDVAAKYRDVYTSMSDFCN